MYDLHSREIVLYRNIEFHKLIFPYSNKNVVSQWNYLSNIPTWQPPNPTTDPPLISQTNPLIDHSTPSDDPTPYHIQPHSSTSTDLIEHNPLSHVPTQIRKSTRPKQLPKRLLDYSCKLNLATIHTTPYPIQCYISYDNTSSLHQSYIFSIAAVAEPTTYAQASQDPAWITAMEAELNALAINKTWEIVSLPPHVIPIGSK